MTKGNDGRIVRYKQIIVEASQQILQRTEEDRGDGGKKRKQVEARVEDDTGNSA
ncbi:MAG: hypothetical protein ACKPKO_59240 [Candidatus Fonsibacter sp.]